MASNESKEPEKPKIPDYRKLYALGLPSGSVRALLALMIAACIWVWMWLQPNKEVPNYLRDLLFIILGHYFASRSRNEAPVGPPPLFLPKGSVRTLLILGFFGIAGMLFYQHRIVQEGQLNHAGVTLILVAGFLGGVLINRITPHHPPRILEDIRAIVSLVAGVILILLVFNFLQIPNGKLDRFLLKYRFEDVLAALVGFYFGSRS